MASSQHSLPHATNTKSNETSKLKQKKTLSKSPRKTVERTNAKEHEF